MKQPYRYKTSSIRPKVGFPFNLLDGSIKVSLRTIEYLVKLLVTKIMR